MRNRILGRRWQFGRDRRRHRGDLNVIGLASQPHLSTSASRSRFRYWKLLLLAVAMLLAIGAVQGGWL